MRRFFYNVRPYFKPYRVGRHEYRGANAGDFAAINEIDLMLGLCRVGDPAYAGLVLEKMSFMTVEDQALLQACVRRASLMDELLEVVDGGGTLPAGVAENLRAFVAVCEAHGRTAAQHHDLFVRRFIEQPSESLDERSSGRSPRAARRCPCCSTRSRRCATSGWRRRATTSRHGSPTAPRAAARLNGASVPAWAAGLRDLACDRSRSR